jgi:DNA-binding PadR family transcriptional regulator
MNRSPKRSSIALAVLVMLCEAPMHPYRMQRLLKERGKDAVINVEQRASLYQTIQRLERDGLILARQTIRDDKRPERTVYEITEEGRATALQWMRQILATPTPEYPEFPAAVSFLALLTPEDAADQLARRAQAIEAEVVRIDQALKQTEAMGLPRLFMLESEYVRAAQLAELTWVKAVLEDLRASRLKWDEAWLREIAAQFSTEPVSGGE